MKRLLSVTSIATLSVIALALGTYTKTFESTYKVSKDSELGKASCAACHTKKGAKTLNAYGKDLEAALGGSKKITADALKKIEAKDSDGDGVSNVAEIKAGKLPGAK